MRRRYKPTRRQFVQIGAAATAGAWCAQNIPFASRALGAPVPGGSLDPTSITKFVSPMVIPPAMPRTGKVKRRMAKNVDYYEIAVRQFQQQILPAGLPATTVWSYGSVAFPGTVAQGGSFNYPAFTIESKYRKPARVKWINDLVDANGNYLPHLLPVDQTLHWANPAGPRDMRGSSQDPYLGPVPMVTHVHGAHTFEESDGYPEAWFLPAALNIPAGMFKVGSYYDQFNAAYQSRYGDAAWALGSSTFQYANDQSATTLWYHDHTLGMTRLNVYAGPAGFYLIRGGPGDAVIDLATGTAAMLPGPAPALGDAPGMAYYEIPIVIQDRSFDVDGSLFYPDNRAFFEALNVPPTVPYLDIPFWGDPACDGVPSDVSPIWNPEFFGNTMVVNGVSWPYLNVEQRRYRFRLLNGCNSRFLILKLDTPGIEVWQIGGDGGFLAAPVNVTALNGGEILLGPAERADVIVDFTNVPVGTPITMLNLAPDEPFGGGVPGVDFDAADPGTTGQVMEFRVMAAATPDISTPPMNLVLPAVAPPLIGAATRPVSLNEEESATVKASFDLDGNLVFDCPTGEPFGPTSALLGTLNPDGTGNPQLWMDPVTENPVAGTTETWEIHNFTMDAHPIHVHLVQFQVVDREPVGGVPRPPEPGETGFKDTVIAYPGEITRLQARFDIPGRYVWHCHIVEHEDNEMMRPYDVV